MIRYCLLLITILLIFATADFPVQGQDLPLTPEGRLGGREPLPTQGMEVPTTPPASRETPSPTSTPPAGPSVVDVYSTVRVVAFGRTDGEAGAGAVAGPNRVLTAAALVRDARRIEVVSGDGRRLGATLHGIDLASGLALLDVPGIESSRLAPRDDSGRPGDNVVVDLMLDGREIVPVPARIIDTQRAGADYPAATLLLLDLPFMPGMAGAPVRLNGRLGGMVLPPLPVARPAWLPGHDEPPIIAGSVFAMAADMATIRMIMEPLEARGLVDWPSIGAHYREVTVFDASRLGLPEVAGTVVTELDRGGPAALAGVLEDDVILSIDGLPPGTDGGAFRALAAYAPGDRVTLAIWRAGARLEIDVFVVEARPGD
jgi:serine protease Do